MVGDDLASYQLLLCKYNLAHGRRVFLKSIFILSCGYKIITWLVMAYDV